MMMMIKIMIWFWVLPSRCWVWFGVSGSGFARENALAGQILQARPMPRARWRTEQFLDLGFNVTIGLVLLAILGGVWLLMHRSGLVAVSNDAVDLLGAGLVTLARRVAPSVPMYAGAAALLVTTLGLWWWAERELT